MLETITDFCLGGSGSDQEPLWEIDITVMERLHLQVNLNGGATLLSSCCGDDLVLSTDLRCRYCRKPDSEAEHFFQLFWGEPPQEEAVLEAFTALTDPLNAILQAPLFLQELSAFLRACEQVNYPMPEKRWWQSMSNVRLDSFRKREHELRTLLEQPTFMADFGQPKKPARFLP